MVDYTVIDAYGSPRRWGQCDAELLATQAEAGEAVVSTIPPSATHIWDGQQWVERPTKPEGRYAWVAGAWQAQWTIAQAREAKNAEINRWREQANETFEHGGKTFSADALSWKDISGAHGWIVATGAMPPGWPGAWKAVDNTFLAIGTVPEWLAFYGAAVATGSANFTHSQALKTYMNDPARTIAEVDAITWDMEIPT